MFLPCLAGLGFKPLSSLYQYFRNISSTLLGSVCWGLWISCPSWVQMDECRLQLLSHLRSEFRALPGEKLSAFRKGVQRGLCIQCSSSLQEEVERNLSQLSCHFCGLSFLAGPALESQWRENGDLTWDSESGYSLERSSLLMGNVYRGYRSAVSPGFRGR